MGGGEGKDVKAGAVQTISLRLALRREAERDLLEATDWYEAERPGLGDEFQAAADECLGKILERPRAYSYAGRGVRKARLKRFPYQVFYRRLAESILVYAVLHDSRDPKEWRKRVK